MEFFSWIVLFLSVPMLLVEAKGQNSLFAGTRNSQLSTFILRQSSKQIPLIHEAKDLVRSEKNSSAKVEIIIPSNAVKSDELKSASRPTEQTQLDFTTSKSSEATDAEALESKTQSPVPNSTSEDLPVYSDSSESSVTSGKNHQVENAAFALAVLLAVMMMF